ncbi:prolyl oligopeptidase family serine peptidase [Oleiharenicola sp. Vm1]|uniref:S9 family peptidase n=1 Tax=Oleiharenicola sp. Vm1 TaxID=3398393 RepID=UPI0039F4CA39
MKLSGLRLLRLVAGLTLLASLAPALGARELLPVETFFDDNSIRQMALSPDGNKIAMIAPNNGRYSIALLDTTNGKTSVVVHFSDENIRSVFWKGNDRLLFTSNVEGHEVPLLASTDLQGKTVKRILESRRRRDDFSLFFGSLEDTFPKSDDHILILGYTSESEPSRIAPSVPRNTTPNIYQVNVETAKRLQLTVLERGSSDHFFDGEGNLRLASFYEGSKRFLRSRTANGQPWHTLRELDPLAPALKVEALSLDGKTAYVISYAEHDRGVLREMDPETGALGRVLFDPPAGEIQDLLFSRDRSRLVAVRWEDAKEHIHWFDEKWRALQAGLEQGFKGYEVAITSVSLDEKRFLFRVHSDRTPGLYYLGDLRGKGLQVQPLSAVRPAIKADQMRPMEIVNYTARDGLPIQGYLTRPAGSDGKRVPLIVLPHGGPWARDSWGYNGQVQFLASRGYAVLQMNFRSSSGYGRAFMDAGDREWGAKMQDDITDGVKWAVDQGIADPARIGIMGGSYGGYATLAGVTTTPELYQFGINIVGVADLKYITRYDVRTNPISRAAYVKMVGEGDEFLRSRSPVNFIANVRVPTFHAYGRNDPRVEIEQWQELEAQLKKHGKPYEILLEESEGHGFEKAEAAIKLYKAIDAFLARHLPADGRKAEAKPGDVRVVEMPAKPGA